VVSYKFCHNFHGLRKKFPFYPGAGQNSLNGDDGGEEGGEEFISRSLFLNVFLLRKIMKWGMRKGGKGKIEVKRTKNEKGTRSQKECMSVGYF
jgi:hypothetical protein